MKTKRIKAPTLSGIQKFYDVVDEIASELVQLRSDEALRDAAIQETRLSFEPMLGERAKKIEALTLLADNFAKENRELVLPGPNKSATTTLAKFGFKTGNPTVKTRSGWTMAGVLNCIRERELTDLLRQPEVELDKDRVHALHASGKLAIGEIGLRITQSESFYVEPKEKEEVRP